jgi:hypothetical protein
MSQCRVVCKLQYRKEWDEEAKRNVLALENIQALFGKQMF